MSVATLIKETPSALKADLQSILVNLIDFGLQVKQAHWNVRGSQFKSLHEAFDELAALNQKYVDDLAERLLALDHPADGRLSTVHSGSGLPEFPEGFVQGPIAASHLVESLGALSDLARKSLENVSQDPVSEDLVLDLLRDVEKQRWMLKAQLDG